jgi:3-phosphoshikimate 1-carboxyvinyltransferase
MDAAAKPNALPWARQYRLSPPAAPFHLTNTTDDAPNTTRLDLPGSKSLTNRALLIAALATGQTTLDNVLFSDDTQCMFDALQALGFALTIDPEARRVTIQGQGGQLPHAEAELFLGNAGTAMRFLTAACCLGPGPYTLKGIPRMHERPIGQLVEALGELGGGIDYLENQGYPPLRIEGGDLAGGTLHLPKAVSSQYISALMQIAPCLEDGLTLQFDAPLTSRPYVEMTAKLISKFGALVEDIVGPSPRLTIAGGTGYQGGPYTIEPDASNASYFLAAAALIPDARCHIEGLGDCSTQGDVWFQSLLREMGVGIDFNHQTVTASGPTQLRGIDEDLGDMPDMAQTLAVLALFAKGPTTMRGIGNLRVKETDRIIAMQNELTKLGAQVHVNHNDDLTIHPPANQTLRHPDGRVITHDDPAIINTYDDHRMAMSFALAGLRQAGIIIDDPRCVRKTFPGFFQQLQNLGAVVEPIDPT